LETSSQVGQQVVSILELDQLLDEVVGAIQSQFGYYCVSVWLLNDTRDAVVLRANRERGGHRFPNLSISIGEPHSIVVAACLSEQTYLANDVSADPVFMPVVELAETRSELALPLRMGARPVGVLDIQSDRLNEFAPEDVPVLQMLASQITTAIRNAQLYDAEKQRRWLAESLEQTGRILSSSLDMSEVPNRILEQLSSVVAYSRGSILLKEGDELRVVAQRGFPEANAPADMRVPIRPGDVFHQLEETSLPVIIGDVTTNASWQQVEGLPVDRSWLGVPLISKGQVIGFVSLTRHEASMFGLEDATLVSAFAGQAAVSLENASLYDKLARFNEQLELLVQRRTAELEDAYEKLSKTDKMKSNFITVTAHELRTPLTLIKGYASLLKSMMGDKPDAVQFVDGILNGENRLLQVVNSMLDISKIDSQALEVHKASTMMWEILENVRLEYQAALEERNLTLTMDGLNALPALLVDPVLMTKLFSHLVGNAVKYTPDGGSIRVIGQRYSENDLEKVQGEWVEIVVTDTGIGIDPAEQQMIFEKFYQTGAANLHSSGKTKFKGGCPGLGLAIARGIVQAHEGQIWVESPGHNEETCPGSSFHVLLPLIEPPK
jgi:signal transduction histidine kinase